MRFTILLTATLFISLCAQASFDTVQSFENETSKIKVLVFLSSRCPCSRSHVEHLNKLKQRYTGQIALFGVITDHLQPKNYDEIKSYYSSQNFAFPLIQDSKQILIKKYGALKTPYTVILSRQENEPYSLSYQGGVTNKRNFKEASQFFLSENLVELSHNRPPKYRKGKSLGCYIRRI